MNGRLDSNFLIGQVQITNSFETSTLEINPPGFDVQDYQRLMPNNELALTTGTGEVVKPKGNKRQPDKWYVYPDRTVLDIIMATEVCKFLFLFLLHCLNEKETIKLMTCLLLQRNNALR
ncbi:hypothetical protein HID58_042970 [Brassica napus]|uniref:Uncharacterized protein n=1 Tax=Brassica napus TaxID=3708 RepID=A0ABQ8BF53_BRANA|nr:hypothetical protein HID58_042970 [Brassica napus]